MLLQPHRPASGLEIIDSIPRLLFYTWFSLFTALSIMGAYLAWFGTDTAKEVVSGGWKPATSVYDYIKIRPHERRAKPKKPVLSLKSAAQTPCAPAAPRP